MKLYCNDNHYTAMPEMNFKNSFLFHSAVYSVHLLKLPLNGHDQFVPENILQFSHYLRQKKPFIDVLQKRCS